MAKVERFVGFMYHATQGFEVRLGLHHDHIGLPIPSYMCRNVVSTWDTRGRGECEHDTWKNLRGK